ncbi:MAG TPA: hypothetical protein VHS31_09180 [Tepidisphaeraceae bacterium]|jgi:hypothetical protein|nr:hypothetical protein [Tepidisphaeraceae bacterium]
MKKVANFTQKLACFLFPFTLLLGCAKAHATPASTAPSADKKFTDAKSGIEATWPAGWSRQQDKDYELLLIPEGSTDSPDRWISLDIPELPMHIPDMIPIGSVENGYLDDLRKQFGKIDVKELSPPAIPESKLRLVRTAWQKDGRAIQQTALLIVHGDHVYILRAHSDAKDEQSVRPTFDSVAGSIKWTKGK